MGMSQRPLTRRRVLVLGAGAVAAVAVTGHRVISDREQPPGPAGRAAIEPVDPSSVPDPFRTGEPIPGGFLQIMGRDLIQPVYDPRFVDANEIGWPDDADVIGVEIDGAARAYPVGFLSGREMVNDEIAGIPILVTW